MLSKDVPVRGWTSFTAISHETALRAFLGLVDEVAGREKGLKGFLVSGFTAAGPCVGSSLAQCSYTVVSYPEGTLSAASSP